jgi:hypothetical protein
MGRGLVVTALAVLGLLCAAGMGYAAYFVSRGSVAVPVTRLQQAPQTLTPARVDAQPKARRKPVRTSTRTVTQPPTTTVDDHGGGGGHRGRGGGGGGGGGHGGDD